MRFYCPNCQKEYDVEPKETITTQTGRVAYKADCPVCGQDMAEFMPQQTNEQEQAGAQSAGQEPAGMPATSGAGAQSTEGGAALVDAATALEPAGATVTADTTTDQAAVDSGHDPSLNAAQAELDKAASDLVENPVAVAEPTTSATTGQKTTGADTTAA